MHKTGTTSIQRFLALNRERFAACGVLLPNATCDNGPRYVSHHQLAYELSGGVLYDARYGGLDDLVRELQASAAHTACISSENLSLLWHAPTCFIRLRDAIVSAGFRPKIVCYVRPQASFCTSVYAQLLSDGGYRQPFPQFLNDTLRPGGQPWEAGIGPPFEYQKLIEPLVAVFGREAVLLRRYRSTAPDTVLLLDFARFLIPFAKLADFEIPAVRENGSLDFGGVLTLLGSWPNLLMKIKFAPLNVGCVLRFGRRFRIANVALATRYGLVVPAFEWSDIVRALPFRRTVAKTQALVSARRTLMRQQVGASALSAAPLASLVTNRLNRTGLVEPSELE